MHEETNMLKHFKSSPLWLIGLFIILAQGTAGVAAVQIDGWPQAALVLFVIFYSTTVTAVFFAFLWFKPENFYGPSEYGDIPPNIYANALRGLPNDTAQAVAKFETNPKDNEALFSLIDTLVTEDVRQNLILMRRSDDLLDISNIDELGMSHHYEIITRNKGISVGYFSPDKFVRSLKGTELIKLSGGNDKLFLTQRGKDFTDWLISLEKDAETFNSTLGSWGKKQKVSDVMSERFSK